MQAIPNEAVQTKIEPEEAERAPVQGAFGGLLFGMLAVPILVIVGTMLCLTGLGAILGIPMIAAAVFAPLLGPMIGLGAVKGKCPWCGISVSSIANAKDFDCHGCGKQIAIKHRVFVTAG
jgi:DNA-directed RNA polymerase subunit RPC12/RpoP